MITPYSFLMAVLWCNVFILVSALLRRRTGFLIHFSVVPLLLLMFAGLLRLFLSVELPFTSVIRSEVIFPAIQRFLRFPLPVVFRGENITVTTLIIALWALGCIISMLKIIRDRLEFRRKISVLPETRDARITAVMADIVQQSGLRKNVKIIQSPAIGVPMITGFISPTIYMPDMELTDEELRYILRHEWNHFIHKDAWVRLLIDIICSVCWWNPVIYVLKRDLDQALEIKADVNMTAQLSPDERTQYLDVLVKVIKHVGAIESNNYVYAGAAGLIDANSMEGVKTKQRFDLVLDYKLKKMSRFGGKFLFYVLTLAVLFSSFLFVIQPYTEPPALPEEGIPAGYFITPDNAYLIKNDESGGYALYADGVYRHDVFDINREPFLGLPIK